MTWTTPKVWSIEPLEADEMNTYVSNNLQHLYDWFESATQQYNSYVSATTDSSTPVDVDGTNLSFTITTVGNFLEVQVACRVRHATANRSVSVYLDIDGTDYLIATGDDDSNNWQPIDFTVKIALSAGEHTVKLQYSALSGTASAQIEVRRMSVGSAIGATPS